MTQPICGEGFCEQESQPPPEPKADSLGAWMLIVAILAIFVIDGLLVLKKRKSMSNGFQRWSRTRRWFRWLGASLFALLTLHLFWGGPI